MKRRSSLISKPIDTPRIPWFEDNTCVTPEKAVESAEEVLIGQSIDAAESALMDENDTQQDPKCDDWPEVAAEMPGPLLVSAVQDLLSELEELCEELSLRKVSNSTSSSQVSGLTGLLQLPKTPTPSTQPQTPR